MRLAAGDLMQAVNPIRRRMRGGLCALAMLLAAGAAVAHAQSVADQDTANTPNTVQDSLPETLKKINIDQRLNAQAPLEVPFVDEAGKQVRLGDYFGKRPVILALVYYQCPILCSQELTGLVTALQMVDLQPGRDFQIVVVSIDPSEGPDLARAKKAMYVRRYDRPSGASGWHFLTGPEASIQALARAAGFHYLRVPGPDGKLNQFAHSTALEVLTPEGRIVQYYMGVEYSPKDLELGLVEASHHQIGTLVDNIMTYCYRYDPHLDRQSLIIARIVQLACVMTVFALGGFMMVSFRRDIKESTATRAASTEADQSDKG